MLTRIKIKSLFNVYDYDIDLTNADKTTVKFLTAPNGFGKYASVLRQDVPCPVQSV